MEKTVMALMVKSDKDSLKTMAYQVCQLTTQAVKHDTEIIDCALTFGGVKNLVSELKKIDRIKSFDSVLIYSPSIFKTREEFEYFVSEVQEGFEAKIRYIRSRV